MKAAKVAISIQEDLLNAVDRWVADGQYPSRSRAIQAAVREKLDRVRRRRLAEEAARLDPAEERALAEEGLATGADSWPAY
jgi:metal-responsive CopG/Arc/MetJ family transcriptional regulator